MLVPSACVINFDRHISEVIDAVFSVLSNNFRLPSGADFDEVDYFLQNKYEFGVEV